MKKIVVVLCAPIILLAALAVQFTCGVQALSSYPISITATVTDERGSPIKGAVLIPLDWHEEALTDRELVERAELALALPGIAGAVSDMEGVVLFESEARSCIWIGPLDLLLGTDPRSSAAPRHTRFLIQADGFLPSVIDSFSMERLAGTHGDPWAYVDLGTIRLVRPPAA